MIKKAGTIYGLILGLISVFGVFIFEGGTVKALFLLAPITDKDCILSAPI